MVLSRALSTLILTGLLSSFWVSRVWVHCTPTPAPYPSYPYPALLSSIVISSFQWLQISGAPLCSPTHCIFCNNTYSSSIVITIQWLLDCLLSFVFPDFYIVLSIFVDLLLFSFSFHSLLKSFLWLLLKAFTIGWWKFLNPFTTEHSFWTNKMFWEQIYFREIIKHLRTDVATVPHSIIALFSV